MCTECAVLYSMVQAMALALALLESPWRVFLASLATVKNWQLATVTQTGTTAATHRDWHLATVSQTGTTAATPQDWQLATVSQTGTTTATHKDWQFDRLAESDTVPQDWLTHHH